MLSVKKDLLAALAGELEKLVPGSSGKAAFESPKVAAHGDFASTAAMQLAKPLKLNPRQLAENLRAALLATPAFAKWVEAIEIAGPGFITFRLKAAAKQQPSTEEVRLESCLLTCAARWGPVAPPGKAALCMMAYVRRAG